MSDDLLEDPPPEPSPSAFRRPALVFLVAVYHLIAGVLVAAPIATFFNSTVSSYPRGDAELFDPGGLMLIEALRLGARSVSTTLLGVGLPALAAVFLGLVPLAALIAGLSRRGRLSRAFLARAAFDRLGTLALLWGVGLAAQILLAVLVVLLGGKVIDLLHLSPKSEDVAYVVVAALTALSVIALGVLRDLAAVAAVADRARFYVSASRALLTAFRLPGRVLGAYALRALASLALLIAAFELAPPQGASLGRAFALHETAIVLGVFLRASWLAAAMRLIARGAPRFTPVPAPVPPPEAEVESPPLPTEPVTDAPPDPPVAESTSKEVEEEN